MIKYGHMDTHRERAHKMHGNYSTTLIVPQMTLQVPMGTHTWNNQDPKE